MCVTGKAGELIDRGDNTYGGKFVVNPSGGLISKGHPLGATGKLTHSIWTQAVIHHSIVSGRCYVYLCLITIKYYHDPHYNYCLLLE